MSTRKEDRSNTSPKQHVLDEIQRRSYRQGNRRYSQMITLKLSSTSMVACFLYVGGPELLGRSTPEGRTMVLGLDW